MNPLLLKREIESLIYWSNEVESDVEREQLYERIGTLEAEREDKLNALANLSFEYEAFIAQQKELIKSRQAAIVRAEFVISALLRGEKIETAEHSFSFRKSTAVNVLNPDALPESFRRIIPEKWEPDKVALGKALKAGEFIPGAELEERLNLQIK